MLTKLTNLCKLILAFLLRLTSTGNESSLNSHSKGKELGYLEVKSNAFEDNEMYQEDSDDEEKENHSLTHSEVNNHFHIFSFP